MKKIVVAIDGTTGSPDALDFACYLGRLTHSKITGVFLENQAVYKSPVVDERHGISYMDWEADKNSEEYAGKMKIIENSIQSFREACEIRSVGYEVCRDSGDPVRDIIHESRYADILVLEAETSFNSQFEGVPTGFVKDILKAAECPVIIAPESFDGIDEIIFAYNASKSSMVAIKQFCYLFPQMDSKKVTVIHIDEGDLTTTGEMDKFRKWISAHYSSIQFETLKGDTETELFARLIRKKNAFIVMGAYGRSTLSQFFKHSRADFLLKALTQAIFITHS